MIQYHQSGIGLHKKSFALSLGLRNKLRGALTRLVLKIFCSVSVEQKAIEHSKLFDRDWYLDRNPDVVEIGGDPLWHYLNEGAAEHRQPHPLFDSDWYVQSNFAATKCLTPLGHYVVYGAKAGADPSILFDTDFYLSKNPDVAKEGLNPLFHFMQHGGAEGRDPHPLFDSSWYMQQNSETLVDEINPLLHFLTQGWKEGLNPHPQFDTSWYVKSYPEVPDSGLDPLTHFLRFGNREGLNPNPNFNTLDYLAKHPEVAESGANALVHSVQNGEGLPEPSRPDLVDRLNARATELDIGGTFISRFMYFIWSNRPDLQQLFDLGTTSGREKFAVWYVFDGVAEYELTNLAFSAELQSFLRSADPAFSESEPWFCRFLRLAWNRDRNLQSMFSLETSEERKAFATWFAVANRQSYVSQFLNQKQVAARLSDKTSKKLPVALLGIWLGRGDLRALYDIESRRGRRNLFKWYHANAHQEYGLSGSLSNIQFSFPERPVDKATAALEYVSDGFFEGANLVGYAKGDFGMGQHLRMTAGSLETVGIPFSVLNFRSSDSVRERDLSIADRIGNRGEFNCNIFHLNADVFPSLPVGRHERLFSGRTNIAYWAWELPHCPPEWETSIQIADEVWAMSQFVADAIAERCSVPVLNMPLAVSGDIFNVNASKLSLGLPADSFCFLYSFDGASWLERKNPYAVVRAFLHAFGKMGARAPTLVLKTMNINWEDPHWQRIAHEIEGDERIVIIDRSMNRKELFGLYKACDCYVSLHRSEGFGFGPAENMLLEKPVILTDYSGVKEYAKPDTACLVKYRLVPVREGEYPLWRGQEWAEPDIEHAAWYMKKLFIDSAFARSLGEAGRKFVETNFSQRVVGARYRARLEQLGIIKKGTDQSLPTKLRRDSRSPQAARLPDAFIQIDSPDCATQPVKLSGIAILEGWSIAKRGVRRLALCQGDREVAEANYGFQRPDVGQAHPNVENSGLSGFLIRVDTKEFEDGPVDLSLIVEDDVGEKYFIKIAAIVDNSISAYQLWRQRNLSNATGVREIAASLTRMSDKAVFGFLMLINDSKSTAIAATISSLCEQSYSRWTLMISGRAEHLKAIQSAVSTSHLDKVRFIVSTDVGAEVQRSSCDYLGFLDPGDILLPNALLALASAVADQSCDLIYSDEEMLKAGGNVSPFFKPDWSPLWLSESNYLGRVWLTKKEKLHQWFEDGAKAEGDLEERFVRWLSANVSACAHIPMVLCTRPNSSPSTKADVSKRSSELFSASELVSIVMLTRFGNIDLVERCLNSLKDLTTYRNFEVLVLANNLNDQKILRLFREKWPYQFLHVDRRFNWSALNNFGAEKTRGSTLLFLNDDVEVLEPNWLQYMICLNDRPSVGVVGARLLYPNGLIQHTGISLVNYGGGARHPLRFCDPAEEAALRYAGHDREWSAVTGACLMVRRELYERLGGFDERLPIIANDTDFCLRAGDLGYRSAVTVRARLIHHEGVSRAGIPEHEDVDRFWRKWGHALKKPDPYMNPNFDTSRDDMTVDPNALASLRPKISIDNFRT